MKRIGYLLILASLSGCCFCRYSTPNQTSSAIPENKWVLKDVEFDPGSDKLKTESHASLDEAAETLKNNPKVRVEVQGYTDNVGQPEKNQKLSEDRAVSVKKYLVSKGIAGNRFETKGYGASHPVADNNTDEGRAVNRRIEFKVLSR